MAKKILDIGNGAVVLNEEGGKFTLSLNETAQLGGGEAAGVVQVQGTGSVVLNAKQAFDLAVEMIKAHSPAAIVPIEAALQGMADAAIDQA